MVSKDLAIVAKVKTLSKSVKIKKWKIPHIWRKFFERKYYLSGTEKKVEVITWI